MKRKFCLATIAASAVLLSACGMGENPPLIFGQTHTVGITISGSVPDQGAELVIGLKDRNIAIIPVTIQQGDDKRTQLVAYGNDPAIGKDQIGVDDTLSVFGQFEIDAEGGTKVEAGLEKFFATGLAARILAEGFKEKLSMTE